MQCRQDSGRSKREYNAIVASLYDKEQAGEDLVGADKSDTSVKGQVVTAGTSATFVFWFH